MANVRQQVLRNSEALSRLQGGDEGAAAGSSGSSQGAFVFHTKLGQVLMRAEDAGAPEGSVYKSCLWCGSPNPC